MEDIIYKDSKGNELKEGDEITLEMKGLGLGDMKIVSIDGELCIYDEIQGTYLLKFALERKDWVIEKKYNYGRHIKVHINV